MNRHSFNQLINHFLDALPNAEWRSVKPHLKLVCLSVRQSLGSTERDVGNVFFPTSARIALNLTLTNGHCEEIESIDCNSMTPPHFLAALFVDNHHISLEVQRSG